MTAVHAKIGSMLLLDPQTQTLRIAAAEGLEDAVVGTIVRVGEGIAGKVAQTGEPVLVEDVKHDARFGKVNDPKYDTSFFICLPLRAQDRIIGVLNLSNKNGQKSFGELDVKFLSTLLGYIGFFIRCFCTSSIMPVKAWQTMALHANSASRPPNASRICALRLPIPAQASPQNISSMSLLPSSPPRVRARVWGWGSVLPVTSSERIAARFQCKAGAAREPRS
jgi:GAF domain